MAFNGGLRLVLKAFMSSESSVVRSGGSRGLHATGIKSMGGHGHSSDPFYMHAKQMYNLDRMKNQKLKMSLGVFIAFSIGVAIPLCGHLPAAQDSLCVKHSLL